MALLMHDKLVKDTEDARNALEEYVYSTRDKVLEEWVPFMAYGIKDTLSADLKENEAWLYTEEGEEASKGVLVERLNALRKVGDPIARRFRDCLLYTSPSPRD